MSRIFLQLFLVLLITAGSVRLSDAQVDASNRSASPQKEDLPIGIKESLAKQRIEREKKDFAELLSRGEEALKLSNELETSFTQNNQLSSTDLKKLDRLEKIVKKIRNELGAGDDDKSAELSDKPLSLINALKALQNSTVELVDELKKTTRYSVSVIAVESSNFLLRVVRFLRIGRDENK